MSLIKRTPRARRDLLDIWEYIALDNPAAADQMVQSINDSCRHLSEYPHSGRSREDIGTVIRSFPVKHYVILYKPQSKGILILRVIHGARYLSILL